ncbi:hypothetical protein IWQ60_009590 [Tieghemiomyces parasiticus]|uniref:Uncharacterized protein n=1 Tax=Tieghemiomyces parasiticus TaxID=78921 RepID=A0A9W7ZMI3_9FUNG|nr:hypothetical protein IWQ60_009590 [Tieghemiomyces parasiticus]
MQLPTLRTFALLTTLLLAAVQVQSSPIPNKNRDHDIKIDGFDKASEDVGDIGTGAAMMAIGGGKVVANTVGAAGNTVKGVGQSIHAGAHEIKKGVKKSLKHAFGGVEKAVDKVRNDAAKGIEHAGKRLRNDDDNE